MKEMKLPAVAVIAIVVGGLSFYGGMMYQKTKLPTGAPGNFRQMTNGRNGIGNTNGQPSGMMRGGGQPGGMSVGEVTAVDAGTMTIKTIDGGSMIVILNSDTKYSKSADASITDVQQGTTVGVTGNKNNDGSMTATAVQLNPAFRNNPLPTPTP